MSTFGTCDLILTASSTITGTNTLLRLVQGTLPQNGQVDYLTARINVQQFPPSPGDYHFKAVIYDDDGAYPGTLKGVSEIVTLPDHTPKAWQQFDFASPMDLTAGVYWVGIIREDNKGNYTDIKPAPGEGITLAGPGEQWYITPPAVVPGGGTAWGQSIFICIHYTVVTNPYPVNRLKTGFVSGFHCFMSSFLYARINGYDPLKLPDGTGF